MEKNVESECLVTAPIVKVRIPSVVIRVPEDILGRSPDLLPSSTLRYAYTHWFPEAMGSVDPDDGPKRKSAARNSVGPVLLMARCVFTRIPYC